MRMRVIRNCGKVGFEFSNIDSEGAIVTRDLLRKLMNEIVRRSTKYYDDTGDHAFYYKEKQLHSVVCPAIAEIADSFLMEHPLKRKPAGEAEYTGHGDYWIAYRNYSFLLELKHSFFSYRTVNNPRESIERKLNAAMEQLESVRKEECRYLGQYTGNLIKIALEAVVFYKGSKRADAQRTLKKALREEDFEDLFGRFMENSGLVKETNVKALWILNERLVEPYEYEDGSCELYPAVALIGRISGIQI